MLRDDAGAAPPRARNGNATCAAGIDDDGMIAACKLDTAARLARSPSVAASVPADTDDAEEEGEDDAGNCEPGGWVGDGVNDEDEEGANVVDINVTLFAAGIAAALVMGPLLLLLLPLRSSDR